MRRWVRPSAFSALLALGCVALYACTSPSNESDSRVGRVRSTEPTVTVVFTYGSEKQNWIEETTAAFNNARHKTAGGKLIHVDAIPMGSGDCVDEILAGTRKPAIISPASAAFIKLGNA